MKVFTIGFTQKPASRFFTLLRESGAKRVVDVRLNNVSQLAGFAKKEDLAFFLEAVCGMAYVHVPLLAPTQAMLDAYKKRKGDWRVYEAEFLALMQERKVEESMDRQTIADGCLLCSEDSPEHCHRRLVAEYLHREWGGLEIVHLR